MGANLRLLRTNQNLTQEELGSIIGAGKGVISSIEAGRTKKGEHIKKIAELFDVPVEVIASDSVNLLLPYITKKRVVKSAPKEESGAMGKPLVKPFEKPADHEPQPMYAHRLKVATAEVKDEDGTTVEEPKKTRGMHDLNIVQLLTCTAGAANKYLAKGWILLDTSTREADGEFMVLLGSTKVVTNEEFETLKREAKSNPTLTYKPAFFGR